MHLIYEEGQTQWAENIQGYEKFAKENSEQIDKKQGEFYKIADGYLKLFDQRTTEATKNFSDEEFKGFEIQEILRLVEIYKRAGVAMVGMTANPKGFVMEVLKRTGLDEKFLDCATDSDIDGLKEQKMKWLFGRLESLGISIPYDRLLIAGDSIWGDLGSAIRLKEDPQFAGKKLNIRGLLIAASDPEYEEALRKIEEHPELAEMLTM